MKRSLDSRNSLFQITKLVLIALFMGAVFLQILAFPGQINHIRKEQGFSIIYEIVLTFICGFWVLCGQIAIIFLWKIVGAMQSKLFFEKQGLAWIGKLETIVKLASFIPVALFILLIPQADDPGFFVLLTIVFLFLFLLALMISLLRDQLASKIAS